MLSITLKGDAELIARLKAIGPSVRRELTRTVTSDALKLEALVKAKLSGQVLKVVTGSLRASIFSRVNSESDAVTGQVASSGDVKYAAIHEFGGRTPARVIEAKGKALAFMWQGKQVFFKRVNNPGATMPERSFLRSSLADMKDEIVRDLNDAVRRGLAAR
jgi:HK97 gp10 family phage protein